MKLKPKDEKILAALLSCGSVADAEKLSGVSRSTIYNRLSDAEFQAEYNCRREKILNEACAVLQSNLTVAVNVVKEIMESKDAAPQTRLNACGIILQNCLKYTEQIEILKKLEKLEKAVEAMND